MRTHTCTHRHTHTHIVKPRGVRRVAAMRKKMSPGANSRVTG